MSGGLSSYVLCSFLVGLIGYVSALVAQYDDVQKLRMCGLAIIQALYLSLISYPILIFYAYYQIHLHFCQTRTTSYRFRFHVCKNSAFRIHFFDNPYCKIVSLLELAKLKLS